MIIVQETTKSFSECNQHIYFLSDDRMTVLGYIPYNTNEKIMFKTPMKFNTKGRTFKTL